MQSLPSVCPSVYPSVCFYSVFRTDSPLALIFCMCESLPWHAGNWNWRSQIVVKVRVRVKTRSVLPRSSIEDSFLAGAYNVQRPAGLSQLTPYRPVVLRTTFCPLFYQQQKFAGVVIFQARGELNPCCSIGNSVYCPRKWISELLIETKSMIITCVAADTGQSDDDFADLRRCSEIEKPPRVRPGVCGARVRQYVAVDGQLCRQFLGELSCIFAGRITVWKTRAHNVIVRSNIVYTPNIRLAEDVYETVTKHFRIGRLVEGW